MKNILLIEDDQVVRENTQEILELSDYKVATAANGELGVKRAKELVPDLIICDIMMPELDGYGVLEAVSLDPSTCHIPFIFLSAKTEHTEIRKGMDMGADDYLTKPYELEELLNAVKGRLAKASLLSQMGNRENMRNTEDKRPLKDLHELKDFFEREGETVHVSKGQGIYAQGDPSNNLYLVNQGVIKGYRLEENGKELITGLFKAGDFFGFTSFTQNIPYQGFTACVEPSEIAKMPKNRLKEILEGNRDISMEFMSLLSSNLSEIKAQLLKMAYGSVRKKTASTLLHFAKTLQENQDGTISVTRYDLANVAGIAKESLIRMLSDFKNERVIDITGRNIKITDRSALERMS